MSIEDLAGGRAAVSIRHSASTKVTENLGAVNWAQLIVLDWGL
jgi:hypothetical protein